MQFLNKIIRLSANAALLGLGLTLVACGGGGGGGGGGGQQPVSYSGNTNQANLDNNSAENINDAYVNASEQNVGSITGAVTTSNHQRLSEKSTLFLMQQLKQNALSSINPTNTSSDTNSTLTGAITIPDLIPDTPIPGDCSANGVTAVADGSLTTTIISQSNTSISARISYANYCTFDIFDNSYLVINGTMTGTITGTNLLNQNALFDSLTLNVPNFSITYTDSTESFNVTISQKYSFILSYDSSSNLTGTTGSLTTDVTYNGLVYRFEIVVNLDATDTPTLTTHRFYHPTHGYVAYESTLTLGCPDGSPDGGILTITGANVSYEITPSGACDGQYNLQQL